MMEDKKITKEDVIKKIKEILLKDERFKDIKLEVIFRDKKSLHERKTKKVYIA